MGCSLALYLVCQLQDNFLSNGRDPAMNDHNPVKPHLPNGDDGPKSVRCCSRFLDRCKAVSFACIIVGDIRGYLPFSMVVLLNWAIKLITNYLPDNSSELAGSSFSNEYVY